MPLAASFLPPELPGALTFLLVGGVSAMLFSLAKTGFGGSVGLLAVPVMTYACGGNAKLATGIMLPLLIAADYVALVSWWRKWNARTVAMLLPGVVVGIAVGWGLLWGLQRVGSDGDRVTNAGMMLGIGAISLGFVVLQLFRLLGRRTLAFRPVAWQGLCAGGAAGFTSTLAHAAGPITTMYLLPQKMPKGRFVATTALFYWINNQLKLVPYFALGLIHTGSMKASAALVPAMIAGALLGLFLHRRIGQKSFTGIVYVLLAGAGVDLIRKGATILWFS